MTQPRRLILVTSHYPFGQSEEFIEVELARLCETFTEVLVLPVQWMPNLAQGRAPARKLPPNARVPMAEAVRLQSALGRSRLLRVARILRDGQALADLIRDAPEALRSGPGAFKALGLSLSAGIAIRGTLERMLREPGPPTVLYAYWFTEGAWAVGTARGADVRVARAHGSDLYREARTPPYQPLQAVKIRRLDRLFAISAHGQAYLRDRLSRGRQRVVLSRLGVAAARRLSSGGDGSVLHLLSCSHLRPLKRVHLVAEALMQCGVRVHWTHLGDGSECSRVRALCERLPPHIRWCLKGYVSHERVVQHYLEQPVDLFVNASEREGLPVSIMEALSFGVPVVAPNVGGVAELVSERCGQLLDRRAGASEIASAIERFASMDPGALRSARRAARQVWYERVNAERQYDTFVATLAELVDESATRHRRRAPRWRRVWAY
ncbi:MAG: glycosyltransferase [Myxococcales bacterium]|nr:glycosyltransferase [Myxococcales bacterium]